MMLKLASKIREAVRSWIERRVEPTLRTWETRPLKIRKRQLILFTVLGFSIYLLAIYASWSWYTMPENAQKRPQRPSIGAKMNEALNATIQPYQRLENNIHTIDSLKRHYKKNYGNASKKGVQRPISR